MPLMPTAHVVADGYGPGTELDYAEVTSPVTVSSTTEAGADTVISGNPVSYDGSTVVIVEFYAYAIANGGSTFQVVVTLWDGATDLGRIAQVIPFGTASGWVPCCVRKRLTPSNGSHTFHIKAWRVGGNGTIHAGVGGTAAGMPAYIRITKA